MTSGEPAEIQRVRALAEQAATATATFTGTSPQECTDALTLLAAAEESAGGRPEVLAWLASRGAGVWERWAQVAGPHDRRAAWEAAVDAGRAAAGHTPGSLLRQNNLAVLLLQLYGVSGRRDALDEAIAVLGRVLAATPADKPGRSDRAANLAVALEDRFRLDGDPADLDAAITALQAVTEAQPDDVAVMVNLATLHRSRFRALGRPADLVASEHLLRRVYTPDGDPAVAGGLGLTLARQFETVGGEAVLDEAVTLLTDAVQRTPARDPVRPARLTNLALALLNRAEFVSGARTDADEAIELLRDAVADSPPESVERASRLTALAGALRRRALLGGTPDDLDAAVDAHRQALNACPPGHVDRYAYLNNLANALRDRYQRGGSLADLDTAIVLLTEAADATNAVADRRLLLAALGIALGERANQVGDVAARDRAIGVFRDALADTAPDSPYRLRGVVNLGAALHSRGSDADLAEAADLLRDVLGRPGGNTADRAEGFNVLALVLSDLVDRVRGAAQPAAALDAARAAFDATDADSPLWPERMSNLAVLADHHGLAPAEQVNRWFLTAVDAADRINRSVALYTAGNWASSAERAGDWPTAVTAYHRALEAMSALDCAQLNRRDRERWLTAATGLAARAGYAALSTPTPQPAVAMRMVDRGQAVLLATALGGTGVDHLAARADTLAEVVAAVDEPVVVLAATARGGYALLLDHDGSVRDVPLPALTPDRVRRWVDTLAPARPGGHLTPLLTDLWNDVLAPVVAQLPPRTQRLALVPAGSLRLLPLHAATGPDGSLLDRFTVSYTPNLDAMLAAHRSGDAPLLPPLAAGDPVTLPHSDLELAAVARYVGSVERGRLPTVGEVLDAMPAAGLIHLACHGTADRDDPARSRLRLADGELSVRQILDLAPRHDRPARLVVLSACESATIGDVLPDEAISLPVALAEWGAAAVVGTLWRVADESTAILVRTFYQLWRSPPYPSPADALAAAQRALRRMTNAELLDAYPELFARHAENVPSRYRAVWESARRYQDPYYWAPFALIGR